MKENPELKKDSRSFDMDIDKHLKVLNENIVVPQVLKQRTRGGGYISWPRKKIFSNLNQAQN